MKSRSPIVVGMTTLCALLMCPASTRGAGAADTRFQWSSDRFAAQCGFSLADVSKAEMKSLTDRNYSDKWERISAQKLKTCQDCYRFAEVTSLGKLWVVRLSMDSESGDWLHEIHYCFDVKANLRALQSVFNCGWGWSYVRVFSFENGSLKPLASRWQKLESGKEIAQPENANDMKDHWDDVPMYKAFSNLPFAN